MSYFNGYNFPLFSWLNNIGYRVELTRVDFPLPLTPVTTVITPKGNSTSIFFRLFPFAPNNLRVLFHFLLFLGISISSLPLKNFPVIEFLFFIISFGLPKATTSPPKVPAPGPISSILSACIIVSSSCSTTIKVFPNSLSLFKVASNLSLSFWCSPILGSSSTYRTPVSPEPIWVASLILWDSPPDKVLVSLERVK